jgi:hypothetical protein
VGGFVEQHICHGWFGITLRVRSAYWNAKHL